MNAFGEQYNTNCNEGLKFHEIVNINHKLPLSSIGRIERNLIFPHSICNKLRSDWKEDRLVKFSFSGLATERRRNTIEKWIATNRNSLFLKTKIPSQFRKYLRKIIFYWQNISDEGKNIVEINFSSNGRSFPIKSWDQDYYDTLLNSQFVLCPSGDFIWTYRFFESILAGAIPVIEEYCGLYNGFRYKFMKDDISTFNWSREDAEYNYKLCKSMITIPKVDLNEELYRIIKESE